MSHSLHDFAASDHDHRNRACQCGPVGWVVVRRSAGALFGPCGGTPCFAVCQVCCFTSKRHCCIPCVPLSACRVFGSNHAVHMLLHMHKCCQNSTLHTHNSPKHTTRAYRDARVRARTRSRATQWTPVSGVSTVPRDDHAPAAPRRPLRRSRLGATGSRAWGCRVPARRRG